jgi:hypothetical protein
MPEIIRKYTYLPEVVVSSAGSSTTRAARHKWKKRKKKIGAEFMTSVSYRPEVIKSSVLGLVKKRSTAIERNSGRASIIYKHFWAANVLASQEKQTAENARKNFPRFQNL